MTNRIWSSEFRPVTNVAATPDSVDEEEIKNPEEQEEDDLELVAVITAAVAAASGSSGSDGFVVRSIKRRNNSVWNM